ncbi:hypothetical protein HK101_005926 [Irineochytrium annulatum]|nr:hypothetical protein HK101_005926 [Irineochytrium annulatum]
MSLSIDTMMYSKTEDLQPIDLIHDLAATTDDLMASCKRESTSRSPLSASPPVNYFGFAADELFDLKCNPPPVLRGAASASSNLFSSSDSTLMMDDLAPFLMNDSNDFGAFGSSTFMDPPPELNTPFLFTAGLHERTDSSSTNLSCMSSSSLPTPPVETVDVRSSSLSSCYFSGAPPSIPSSSSVSFAGAQHLYHQPRCVLPESAAVTRMHSIPTSTLSAALSTIEIPSNASPADSVDFFYHHPAPAPISTTIMASTPSSPVSIASSPSIPNSPHACAPPQPPTSISASLYDIFRSHHNPAFFASPAVAPRLSHPPQFTFQQPPLCCPPSPSVETADAPEEYELEERPYSVPAAQAPQLRYEEFELDDEDDFGFDDEDDEDDLESHADADADYHPASPPHSYAASISETLKRPRSLSGPASSTAASQPARPAKRVRRASASSASSSATSVGSLSAPSDVSSSLKDGAVKRRRKPPKMHACTYEGCERTFPRRYNLNSHMLSHTGERPYCCIQAGCGVKFARRHDLRRHERTMHDETRPFGCATCSHRFAKLELLNRHLMVENHAGER